MTPLARQEAEAGNAGWGGLSSSDSSLSDSREAPGDDLGVGMGALAQGLGLWGSGWASDQTVLGPEQVSSLGGGASWGVAQPEGVSAGPGSWEGLRTQNRAPG